MWDAISYVEPTRRPVVHEGFTTAKLVVTNAGPAVVDLQAWHQHAPPPGAKPNLSMRMPPGGTRSVSGEMIAVAYADDQSMALPGAARFAAIGWRLVP